MPSIYSHPNRSPTDFCPGEIRLAARNRMPLAAKAAIRKPGSMAAALAVRAGPDLAETRRRGAVPYFAYPLSAAVLAELAGIHADTVLAAATFTLNTPYSSQSASAV